MHKAKFGHKIQEKIELTCDVYENTITPKAMGKDRMSMLRVTFENPQVWILSMESYYFLINILNLLNHFLFHLPQGTSSIEEN